MDRSWKSIIFQTFFAHPDNIRLKAQAPIIKNYLREIAINKGRWGIDIGCGTGRYTGFLSRVVQSVVCIDPSYKMLCRVKDKFTNQSRQGFNVLLLLVRGEVENLPFKPEIFDIALLLEVLEHIEDDRQGLNEINRILKPNATLILSTPHPPPVYPDRAHKRKGYTQKELFILLKNTGFKIKNYTFCMFIWARITLRFAVIFISIFKFPPPILFLLKFEHFFKKRTPFDIIVKSRK
jgi:ubiquinone/menaquinone biosynthesis C-methylase UbiE